VAESSKCKLVALPYVCAERMSECVLNICKHVYEFCGCVRCASMPFKNRALVSLVEAAGHGCGKITSPRAALRNEKEAEIDP
jgi:hypothetical protein